MCREGSGLFSMESTVLSFVSIDHNVFTCFGCECGMFSFPPSYLNIEIHLSKSVSYYFERAYMKYKLVDRC